MFPGGGGPDVLGEGRWMACSPGWDWYNKKIMIPFIYSSEGLLSLRTLLFSQKEFINQFIL